MFKVGQKVWSFIQKKYMFVSQIEAFGCFLAADETLKLNYYHSNADFHATAEDMLTALGFKRHDMNGRIIYVEEHYNVELKVDGYELITTEYDGKVHIDATFEEALHQLMAELKAREGWLLK